MSSVLLLHLGVLTSPLLRHFVLADAERLLPQLRDAGAVDALVTLLRCGSDGPVRQNAAIAVARFAKDPAVHDALRNVGCCPRSPQLPYAQSMARIRELRGMEMLVQMGSALVK